ncbi:hypothetical protein GQ600_9916 [Phytophthora cactorum]|nr:hypothetical protein GQ600_9916 [Phytophthora cactorum]
MTSFRTFLPLSQPSFVEVPQLLGLKPIQQQKPRGSSNKTFAPIMAPPSGSSKIAKRRPLQNVSVSNGSVKVSGKAGIMLANGTVVKKGSKYCMVEGCTSSVKCKVPDCANRAKTKGVCWSHGGGTLCSFRGCTTISVSNALRNGGLCSPAYERTDHLCTLHFEEKQYIAQVHSHNAHCHQLYC